MATEQPKVPSEIEAGIKGFDATSLKHTETVEKQSLPSPEVVNQEKTIKLIEEYDKDKLKHAETQEKNTLPTNKEIEEEKRASKSS